MDTFETKIFYRGVSEKHLIDRPYIVTPRMNRRPKDSTDNFHNIADKWFQDKFGIPYRSCGVFVTSRRLSATLHAATPSHVVRVIPISDYRFCWSPKAVDLFFLASRFATSSANLINAKLESLGYTERDLGEAYASGHEVMIYCSSYIAIPVGVK